jgi:hypothetical protein
MQEDSMHFAKNNVGGIENNYLKNHDFLYKMSPDDIVGNSVYMSEKYAQIEELIAEIWVIEK